MKLVGASVSGLPEPEKEMALAWAPVPLLAKPPEIVPLLMMVSPEPVTPEPPAPPLPARDPPLPPPRPPALPAPARSAPLRVRLLVIFGPCTTVWL
jgi:hypothetical protein